MSPPLVSALIPVRDAASTLDQAVGSVLAWPERELEVLLVDDGSRDDSLARLRSWERRDDRVRVLALQRRGLVPTLNAGLEACRGRYVARMDADDLAAPRRLEEQVSLLEQDPLLAVVDGQVRYFRDEDEPVARGMWLHQEWINGIRTPADFRREILVESPVVHPAATFRLGAVTAVGGYRATAAVPGLAGGPVPEDYDLWLRLDAVGWRLCKLNRVLVRMRDRPGRLTRTHPAYARSAFRRARMVWLASTQLAWPRRLVVWGAGKGGRPWIRWLLATGHSVVAVVDIDPRKIGSVRQGVPIVAPEDLPALSAELCLVAVAARGAREQIRRLLAQLRPDWIEGQHWWALS